jgi:SAM domain (Sterile alpha motif)
LWRRSTGTREMEEKVITSKLFDAIKENDSIKLQMLLVTNKINWGSDGGAQFINEAIKLSHQECLCDLFKHGARGPNAALKHIMDASYGLDDLSILTQALELKKYSEWDTKEVSYWLSTIGLREKTDEIIKAFSSERLDGNDLRLLDKEDLEKMKIAMKERNIILNEIKNLIDEKSLKRKINYLEEEIQELKKKK